MASSLTPWLHKHLLKYSNTNGTNLDPFVAGVKVQILKWETLESPFWASVGDQEYSIYARFSDESAKEFLSTYGKRLTSLKTSILKLKSFRPQLIRPYQDSHKLELGLFVDKFEQFGMDDEEIHFGESRTPLSKCGGALGEWIVKLKSVHPRKANGEDPTPSLSLKESRPSAERIEPAVEEVPFVPPPVPLEPAAPSEHLRIDPSLSELSLEEYLGSCWWRMSKKEQERQDQQPDFLADGPDTDASIVRALASDKEVNVAAPLEPQASRRASSSSPSSSSDDEEIAVKKPTRKVVASPLSPMPNSSPPRNENAPNQPIPRPATHSPTPPSSSRTATHSSPPSQERPPRQSRTLSAAPEAGRGKNSLRSDGSKVLVEGSDDDDEEPPTSSADCPITSAQKSRLVSPSSKIPLSSSGLKGNGEDDAEEEAGARSQTRSQEDPVATFTSELQGEDFSLRGDQAVTSSNESLASTRKPQDGRDGRPNRMMLRTGSPDLESKSSITSLVGEDSDVFDMQPSVSGSGSGSESKGTKSSDERRRTFGTAESTIEEEAMDVDWEEEEEVEELGRSPRSSIAGDEILSRGGEESGSLEESSSLEKSSEKEGQGSTSTKMVVEAEEETREAEAKKLEEVEMEEAEEEVEVGSLTQVEEDEPSEHVVRLEPQSSPMKHGPTQSPRNSPPPPQQSPSPPAARKGSPTPVRRVRQHQAPPPSSGAFQASSSRHPASSSPPHSIPSQTEPAPIPAIQWPKRVRSPTATPPVSLPLPPASKPASARPPAAATSPGLPSAPPKPTQSSIQAPWEPTKKIEAATSASLNPTSPIRRQFNPPPPPPLPTRVEPISNPHPSERSIATSLSPPPPPPPTSTLKRKAPPSDPFTSSTSTATVPPKRKAAASTTIYDPSKDPFAAKKPTAYRRISSTFANEGPSSSTSSATARSPSVAGVLPREETESPARASSTASALPFAQEVEIESPSSLSRKVVAGEGSSSLSRKKEGVVAGKTLGGEGVAVGRMEKWELHLSADKVVGGLSEEECREVLRMAKAGQ
ncbi:hypothetical protein BDY24DRAFT_437659 [Mrakia frigida]|uniref:uncharacterized protein n=1 Tax=Mrakia frigida TaxID=29902 RepID=UPI003FCC1735